MNREKDNLQSLGRKAEIPETYAPEVLEAFENRHPERDYWVQFNCPEFTTLCPITSQPDFGEIKILYIPDERMVESKSLKLYLFSFRNHGDFHEDVVNIILDDLVKRLGLGVLIVAESCAGAMVRPNEPRTSSWFGAVALNCTL